MREIFRFLATACVACATVCNIAHGSTSGTNRGDALRRYQLALKLGRKDIADRLAGSLNLHDAVETVHSNSRTTIHSAAANGNEETVKRLVLAGALVDAKDSDGMTPFHLALKHGHFSIADFLLKNGANINTASRSASTALHEAARRGNFTIVQWMVSRGASLNARDKDRWTAYHLAIDASHKAIVDFLNASGANIVTASTTTSTLHSAVRRGYMDVVELLLRSGAYINARSSDWMWLTPFHEAILAKQKEIAEFLLFEGAHPSTSSFLQVTGTNYVRHTTFRDAQKNGWNAICEVIRSSDEFVPPVTCGHKVLSSTRGHIFSPAYPQTTVYGSLNCTWTIVAPGGNFIIRLSFEDFYKGSDSGDCRFGYLAIFRGDRITYERLMHRYCGTILPDPIAVEAERLTLQFYKDGYYADRGFDIVYTIEALGKPTTKPEPTGARKSENAEIATATTFVPPAPQDAFERLDLWEFQQNQVQLELFLRSLHELQVAETSSASSFFAMAAVHGYPREAYDGIEPPPGKAGFCEHRNALFPIWHRPYMLLFENAIRNAAAIVVSRYDKPLRAKYEAELPKLRLPYWDWAKRADIPGILKQSTIAVEGYKGGRERIANPLHSYMFQRSVATEDTWAVPSMEELASTRRHRDEMTQWQSTFKEYHQTIKDAWCNALQATEYGMLSINPRNEANAATVWADHDAQLFTMERAHDLVHVVTGGHGGHMAYVESAAFDPIFFLHHSNVDRLLYLWQIAHLDEWLPTPSNQDDSHQEYNSRSDLRPFNATPEGMRNIRGLGYLYPESALAADNMTAMEIMASLTSAYKCKPVNRQTVYAKIIARLDGFGSVRVVVSVLRNSNPTISQNTSNPIFLSSMKPQRTSRVVHAVDITDAVKSSRFNFQIPNDIHFGAGSDFNVSVAVYSCASNMEISLREAGLELIQIFHAPEGPFGVKHLLCQRNVSSVCQHDYDCAPCETCHRTERSCVAIAASGANESRRSTCRKTCRDDRDCHCPMIGTDTAPCNYCIDHVCTRN